MCRKKKECSDLTTNRESWSKTAPLPPLPWFESQLELFQSAIEQFISGNREQCLKVLSEIRNEDMRDWFIEHGQMSGYHRVRQIKYPKPISIEKSMRHARNQKTYEAQVFSRDGFKCRYCGIRLISKKILAGFTKALDSEIFRKGPRNVDTHGIIHIFNPVADHVVPWHIGGKTDLDNLVTSCGARNYGKHNFTIDQLGILNPSSRPPLNDGWDGLSLKLDALKKVTTDDL